MNLTRRQALLGGVSSLALMGFFSGGRKGAPTPHPIVDIDYVDATINHTGTGGAFTTWNDAQLYLRANVDPARQRGRVTYEYSTIPYGDTQVPDINAADRFNDRYGVHIRGQAGGPATAIDDIHVGDDVTATFAWSLPGGVVSPIGAGDLDVRLNGTKLQIGKDYKFTYDSYLAGANEWPSTSGTITLMTWVAGTPATEVDRPLAVGETLTVQSIEARPVLESTSKNPLFLEGASGNPDQQDPPLYIEYYGAENLVLTTTAVYARKVTIAADQVLMKKVFLFKLGANGIADASPSLAQHPRMFAETQFELVDSTLFDCTSLNAATHLIYGGWFGTSIFENVVATDTQFFGTSSSTGHCFRAKPKKSLWFKNCFASIHGLGTWMGSTYPKSATATVSITTNPPLTVIEDCVFSKTGGGRVMTVTTRKSQQVCGTGGHGWQRTVYPVSNLKSNTTGDWNSTDIRDKEWNLNVPGGTTVFNVQQVVGWDYWDAQTEDDLVVSVWEGVAGEMPILLTSDQFSASLVNGEGTVDLSGGANPAYPSGVPDGSVVFVSCHYKRDIGDFWDNAFWQQVKICGVFETGYASGPTSTVPWARSQLEWGKTSFPDVDDFHVSVEGQTLVAGQDYSIAGCCGDSGFINFVNPLNDGDFYMITTDGHKTQGIPAVNLENIHSIYHNTVHNPGSPIAYWGVPAGHRWPTAHRMFIRNVDFWQDETDGNDRVVLVDGTLPQRDDSDQDRYFHGLPPDWAERMMTFACHIRTWNLDGTWQDFGANYKYGFTAATPQYGGPEFRSEQGAAPAIVSPSKDQLPDWWVTFDDVPARIRY